MIITPDFVFVHYPKTGGTFVTQMLSRLYGDDRLIDVDKHAGCSEVPEPHRHKPFLSTMRNPFDRYVSQFTYGWWKLYPFDYCGVEPMRAAYPHYPDLSFEEFLSLANTLFVNSHHGVPTGFVNDRFPEERRLGWHTEQFIRFYCREPRQVFAQLDEEAIERASFIKDMYDLHFLRTENLRQGLHDYLLTMGHRPEDVAFILTHEKCCRARVESAPKEIAGSATTPPSSRISCAPANASSSGSSRSSTPMTERAGATNDAGDAREKMRDLMRVTRAIRDFNATVTNETREPIERKVRRWQQLRMPALLAPEVQAVRPYDPAWPLLFADEKRRLQMILGGEVAAVEHIGSTSIPGMGSKSILDMMVAVRDIPSALAPLAAAGYEDFGVSPCDHEAVWLWNIAPPGPPGYALIVHVCAADNPWIATALNFRDYMCAFPAEARATRS